MAIPRRVRDDSIIHLVPCHDDHEHDTDHRGKCWCNPNIDDDGLTWIVTHNAMDDREAYISGRRKPH